MTTAIERAKKYSQEIVERIRADLAGLDLPSETVLTCGSYARREASAQSDIDFFVITSRDFEIGDAGRKEEAARKLEGPVRETINKIVATEPAADGAFSTIEPRGTMLLNIGGEGDNNQKITRRMLFLLEGEWLTNEAEFRAIRREILSRYIGSPITDHQLALFLLNDIIRYYRTMAVDYEFKTSEGDKPKPWGIRNIKLVFSRKLLYASGLFAVALTADRRRDEKIKILEDLFDIPVIDRMVEICGASRMAGVLRSYNYFLEKLEDKEVRRRLNNLKREERDDELFRDLKNEGHHFTRELLRLFETTFDSTHPIRRAVMF